MCWTLSLEHPEFVRIVGSSCNGPEELGAPSGNNRNAIRIAGRESKR
jgi:hypothetical protein